MTHPTNLSINNITCSVCLTDNPTLPISLTCGHKFCYLCIKGVKLSTYSATCPLCRHPISNDILTKMSLEDCLDNLLPNIENQWLYKGNNNGWWKYDVEHNAELEKMYQEYISKKAKIHFPTSSPLSNISSNISTNLSSNNTLNSDGDSDGDLDSDDLDSDDSDSDDKNMDDKMILNIGSQNFNIDFNTMFQINNSGHMRQIVRLQNDEINMIATSIKGMAGLSNKKN